MGKNYVIIGSGVAAVTAAKAIRDQDPNGEIMIFGEEKFLPYNRIKLSKDLFSDLKSEKVLIKKAKWYERNQIQLFPNTKITSINTETRIIVTGSGDNISYDQLLLCTGAKNRKLPIEGFGNKGVFSIREMQEAEDFKSYIESKNHITTIGGGVQGLETAWSILQSDKQVTIVEANSRLMAKQLDERTSKLLKDKIEATGVKVHLNASIGGIVAVDEGIEVMINESEFIRSDSVIYSVGVQPNLALVENTPIETKRGIIVNEEMKTNVEGIFAAGDVTELNDEVEGLWNRAMEQGKVAGANMAGRKATFQKTLPVTIFNAFGLTLFSIGLVDERLCDQSIIENDGIEKYTRVFVKDKKVVGVISLDGVAASLPYKFAIENQLSFDKIDLDNISISELVNEIKKQQAVYA